MLRATFNTVSLFPSSRHRDRLILQGDWIRQLTAEYVCESSIGGGGRTKLITDKSQTISYRRRARMVSSTRHRRRRRRRCPVIYHERRDVDWINSVYCRRARESI